MFVTKNDHFAQRSQINFYFYFQVGFHGFSLIQVGLSWFQVCFHGFSWYKVGFSWFFMVFHVFSWFKVGFSCFFMILGARMVFHGSGWVFMVFHGSRLQGSLLFSKLEFSIKPDLRGWSFS